MLFNPEEHKINKYKNEDQFQAAAIMMISKNFPRLRDRVWHPKNEAYIPKKEGESESAYEQRKMIEGAWNKSKGMKSGIADINISYKGILYQIELKQPNGVQSESQKEVEVNFKKDSGIDSYRVCKTLYDVWDYCKWIQNNGYSISM